MGAVTWLVGNGLRRRWRSLISLVLLVGVAGALALAGFAGARRTSSAFDRMVEATNAGDVLVNPDAGTGSALTLEAIAALPMVSEAGRADGVLMGPRDAEEFLENDDAPALASDGIAFFQVGKPVLEEGRLPRLDAAHEVFLDATFARANDLEVGDVLEYLVISNAELEELLTLSSEEEIVDLISRPGFGTPIDLDVVGVGVTADSAVVDEGFEQMSAVLTPAFWAAAGHPSAGYWGAVVRLRDAAAVDEFRDAVEELVPDELVIFQTLLASRSKSERAIDPPAFALLSFGGIALLLGVFLVAQGISRRLQLDAATGDVLAAMGCTRRQRFATSTALMTVVALCGAVLAAVLAWLLSVFTPVGPAVRMEPDPGLHFDAAVLVPGAGAVSVLVVLAALLPAWRSASIGAGERHAVPSTFGRVLADIGAPFIVVTGARFALERGRGATAMPVRATVISGVVGVAVATATIVFASSLDRVVDTPRLYGSDWDAVVEVRGEGATYDADVGAAIAGSPLVSRWSQLTVTEVSVDGVHLPAVAFADVDRAVRPTIAEGGRAPTAAGEVALGRLTMDRLGVGIGDSVDLEAVGFSGPALVVGRAVLPAVGLYSGADKTALGEGVLLHPTATYEAGHLPTSAFVVDLSPTADAAALQAELAGNLGPGVFPAVIATQRPSDVSSLASLRGIPVILAGLLVGLIAATVAHGLAVSVRRRRRDLGVLRTLGTTRSAVRGVVLAQALTVTTVAAFIGLPLGVLAGRWAWSLLASALGTIAEPVVPLLWLLVLLATIISLAVLACLVPAAQALRLHPAEILRSE